MSSFKISGLTFRGNKITNYYNFEYYNNIYKDKIFPSIISSSVFIKTIKLLQLITLINIILNFYQKIHHLDEDYYSENKSFP
jgi:hypothetical protein